MWDIHNLAKQIMPCISYNYELQNILFILSASSHFYNVFYASANLFSC